MFSLPKKQRAKQWKSKQTERGRRCRKRRSTDEEISKQNKNAWSQCSIGQHVLGMGLALDCGWHPQWCSSEENWFSLSWKVLTANNFFVRGGTLCAHLLPRATWWLGARTQKWNSLGLNPFSITLIRGKLYSPCVMLPPLWKRCNRAHFIRLQKDHKI